MKVLILLLVATSAVLSAKVGEDKQKLQQQSPQGPPQDFLQDPQQGIPQRQPQSLPEEPQEGPQQELSENPFQRPQLQLFQETPQGLFQGPQKGDQKKQRPGPQGPHPGPSRPLLPQPVFNNYTTWQLNDIVNRIMRDSFMFRAKMDNKGMNGHCAVDHMRALFVGYNVTLKTVEENFTSCVTDDMKALPEKAITEILSCLPTQSELETKRKESKAAFDALLEKLKAADEEIYAITDDVQKHIKIAQIEWSDVYQFYMEKADEMLKTIQTIQSCVSTQRSSIQKEVTKYLEELKTCTQK